VLLEYQVSMGVGWRETFDRGLEIQNLKDTIESLSLVLKKKKELYQLYKKKKKNEKKGYTRRKGGFVVCFEALGFR